LTNQAKQAWHLPVCHPLAQHFDKNKYQNGLIRKTQLNISHNIIINFYKQQPGENDNFPLILTELSKRIK